MRAQPAAQECIVEVRVHGNHTTPDAEVLRLAARRARAAVYRRHARPHPQGARRQRPIPQRRRAQAVHVAQRSQRDPRRHRRRGTGRHCHRRAQPRPHAHAQGAHHVDADPAQRGRLRAHVRRSCELRGRARPADASFGAVVVGRRAARGRGDRTPVRARAADAGHRHRRHHQARAPDSRHRGPAPRRRRARGASRHVLAAGSRHRRDRRHPVR